MLHQTKLTGLAEQLIALDFEEKQALLEDQPGTYYFRREEDGSAKSLEIVTKRGRRFSHPVPLPPTINLEHLEQSGIRLVQNRA